MTDTLSHRGLLSEGGFGETIGADRRTGSAVPPNTIRATLRGSGKPRVHF